jgi:serine/threonine protein kinase
MSIANTTTETSLFQCYITKQKFRDPVVAEDGHTYERDAIVKWLKDGDGKSPITRQPLNADRLIPNLLVKKLISEEFQFKLDVHVKQLDHIFVKYGKSVDLAEWINKSDGPSIVLMTIQGAQAQKEAKFFVDMSKHAHIVRTYGLVDNPQGDVMLVQERAKLGDLLQLLKRRPEPPSEFVLKEIFIQIADAMSFLAHNKIVHGDLACRNILVFDFDETDSKRIVVKVTDFGLSRGSSIYKTTSTSACSTLNIIPYRYTAPEVLQNPNSKELYTEKSDMYSMGVLMWEAYSPRGKQPWSHITDEMDVKQRVIGGERLQQPSTCSKEMWSIIQTTMAQKSSDRPTFADLNRHLIELNNKTQTQVLSPNVKNALKAIKENQTTITLSKTGLCDEEAKIIVDELKNNSTVHRLILDANKLSNDGAKAIAELLQVNQTINEVNLSENNISSEGATALAQALRNNQTLTSLKIGSNPLLDDGIQSVCEAIKRNKTLKVLWIHNTKISFIGVKLIAEMLRENNLVLEELAIGDNNITDDGAELIADALQINKSLTWLHMPSPDVTDKGALALAQGIAVHGKKFRYFYIVADCIITDTGKVAIKSALDINKAQN